MIRLQDLTPSVYYTQSRDFQFIGRLYDILFNYAKTNAANLYNLPIGRNIDEKLLNLLSMTLGFQSKHNYNSKQLAAVCSVLPTVLRQKGSMNAIITAVNALLCAEGLTQSLDYSIVTREYIVLYLPTQLSDLNLLKDLMPYILPAGLGCKMVKEISEKRNALTELTTYDEVKAYNIKTDPYGKTAGELDGMLRLRDNDVLAAMNNAVIGNTSGELANTTVISPDNLEGADEE